jgi:hypothetical protein
MMAVAMTPLTTPVNSITRVPVPVVNMVVASAAPATPRVVNLKFLSD